MFIIPSHLGWGPLSLLSQDPNGRLHFFLPSSISPSKFRVFIILGFYNFRVLFVYDFLVKKIWFDWVNHISVSSNHMWTWPSPELLLYCCCCSRENEEERVSKEPLGLDRLEGKGSNQPLGISEHPSQTLDACPNNNNTQRERTHR